MATLTELDSFTRAYIEAMLWAENDNSDESGGEPLDANYSASDIAPESLDKIVADCKAFQEKAGELLSDDNCLYKGCPMLEYAGHDFWLTRRGHGCGFWDGDWTKEAGEKLTELAKSFREVDPVVGDDGLIYLE